MPSDKLETRLMSTLSAHNNNQRIVWWTGSEVPSGYEDSCFIPSTWQTVGLNQWN